MNRKIFVTAIMSNDALSILSDFEVLLEKASDEKLSQCEVLIAWPSRVEKDLLRKMKSLKMIQTLSAGVDGLAFDLVPIGVQVYSNAGAFTGPVAEHAWGILLGAAKGLHARNQKLVPRKLSGGVLLVLGCGSIGSEIARLSKSMGMRTIGVSRSFRVPGNFDETYGTGELSGVIGRADAIAIALPLTDLTRELVDYEMLMRTKEHVTVVNVGRGEIVSEEGLIAWLYERPESRYTTDVFWKRNTKESFETDAWGLSNFSGTLHVSGAPLGDKLELPLLEAAKNVRRFLITGVALNRIEPKEYLQLSDAKHRTKKP